MTIKKKYLVYDAIVILMILGVVISLTVSAKKPRAKIPAPRSTITIPKIEKPSTAKIQKTYMPTEAELQAIIDAQRQDPVVEVDMYLRDFLKGTPKYRYKRAKKFIPFVVEYSEKNDIDPLLLSVIISKESSWLPGVTGKKNEKGLTQVHGLAAKGHDVSKPEYQIEAGAIWLRKCIDWCDGDLLGGLSIYQTGYSCRTYRGAKQRLKIYNKAVAMIRGPK